MWHVDISNHPFLSSFCNRLNLPPPCRGGPGLPAVSREAATLLGRALLADSMLGRARPTLLRWLADAGGGGKARQEVQAAAVRAKAIKLLGGAIEADVRVLQMQEVQVRQPQATWG